MSTFTDAKDRQWTIAVTVGDIKRVRNEAKIDLGDPTPETMERLATDPVLLVDVLWSLCSVQAKERGVSDEEFGRALVGDPIDAATEALIEAVVDFFPGQRRSLLRRANAKAATVRQKAYDLALAKLDDPTLEQQVEKAMQARMDADVQKALTRLNGPTNSPDKLEE